MSACSDVIMWERDSDRRPQCTNECRRAIMAMEGSRYSRPQLCCDCDHNDMTPMQRRQCQQHRRNFEQICGMRREVCTYNYIYKIYNAHPLIFIGMQWKSKCVKK